MYSFTEENYLKAMLLLEHTKNEASVNDLSKQLDIKMPTVNHMVKKLAEKELVNYESYKPITLTKKGKKDAALIVRKHRLTEMFLVDKMGFGWEEVHDIAEQIEHIQSPAFFNKMDEILGFPTLDPHGSPIPDKDGNMAQPTFKALSKCKPGEEVQLAAVQNTSEDFLLFLNSRDLKLGIQIEVLSVEKFDGSMLLKFNQKQEMLSKIVCERMLVK